MTLLEVRKSDCGAPSIPSGNKKREKNLKYSLYIIAGTTLVILGSAILGFAIHNHTVDEAIISSETFHVEHINGSQLPFITIEDLKILPTWTKVLITKILPVDPPPTKEGILYWESLVSFRCPILGHEPEILSEVPLLPSRGFTYLDKQIMDSQPEKDIYHPGITRNNADIQCSFWKPLKVHSERRITISRNNFTLLGFNYILDKSIRGRYGDWPSTHFATTWLSISTEEEGCLSFSQYDKIEGVITGRDNKKATIHLSSVEEPIIINYREPCNKCFSPHEKREIFWSGKGFFFYIQILI